ncbi:hypothetical protein QX776_09275 [Alteromonadaceae bacterium BrNp21-10]|nr:hypothetical protein [Alteromonadaceae bacterium BrNp21-10]
MEVKFSGFANLALTYEDSDQLDFMGSILNNPRDGLSPWSDSSLGGQVNLQVSDNVDAVAQIVFNDRSDTDLSNYLTLGFVRYRPNRNWALRAGRMNNNIYILSEYLAAGYAYLWSRPPLDFYSPASAIRSMDGVEAQYSRYIGDGFLQTSLQFGKTETSLDGVGGSFELKLKKIIVWTANYEVANWLFKGSYVTATTQTPDSTDFQALINAFNAVPSYLWPAAAQYADDLDPEDGNIKYLALGMQYDDGDWTMQAELAQVDSDWLLFLPGRFGYISLGYHWGEFTPYVKIASNRRSDDVPEIVAPAFSDAVPQEVQIGIYTLAGAANMVVNGSTNKQYSLGLGVRWDFADSMALKMQLDRFYISPPGASLWGLENTANAVNKQQVNVFSLGLSTIF